MHNKCSIKEWNRKCDRKCRKHDICKNVLVVSPDFTCFATKRKYEIKGILKCESRNVTYLISCKCCGKQYVGSTTGFKERFRIRKSDINTDKARCGVANHLLNVSRSSSIVNRKSFCTKWWWYWQSFVGKWKILASAIIYVKPRVK